MNPLPLVAALIYQWNWMESVAPAAVESHIAVLTGVRAEFDPMALEATTLQDFRTKTLDLLSRNADVLVAMDAMIDWCGADPRGRGAPFR